MNRRLAASSGAVTLWAMLFATTSLAGGFRPIDLKAGTQLNGTELAQGSYTLRWAKSDQNGGFEVKLFDNMKVVASAPAQMKPLGAASTHDSIVLSPNGNGKLAISEIRFAGKKEALAIGG